MKRKYKLGDEKLRAQGAFIEIESEKESLEILEMLHMHFKKQILKQGKADHLDKASPFATEPAAQAVLQLAADAIRSQGERIDELEAHVAVLRTLYGNGEAKTS